MKSKGLIFISCLAAGALIASPSLAKPAKKSAGKSMSNTTRMAAHTTKVMPGYRYQQNRQKISSRAGNAGYYAGTRYTGTRSYAGRQYSGTRYYGGTPYYYGRNNYYGGTQYSYGGDGAIRTEALQCGRTSPLQSRHTLRRRCGRQGITVIRTRTMAAIPTTTRTMAQAMAMLVRL